MVSIVLITITTVRAINHSKMCFQSWHHEKTFKKKNLNQQYIHNQETTYFRLDQRGNFTITSILYFNFPNLCLMNEIFFPNNTSQIADYSSYKQQFKQGKISKFQESPQNKKIKKKTYFGCGRNLDNGNSFAGSMQNLSPLE